MPEEDRHRPLKAAASIRERICVLSPISARPTTRVETRNASTRDAVWVGQEVSLGTASAARPGCRERCQRSRQARRSPAPWPRAKFLTQAPRHSAGGYSPMTHTCSRTEKRCSSGSSCGPNRTRGDRRCDRSGRCGAFRLRIAIVALGNCLFMPTRCRMRSPGCRWRSRTFDATQPTRDRRGVDKSYPVTPFDWHRVPIGRRAATAAAGQTSAATARQAAASERVYVRPAGDGDTLSLRSRTSTPRSITPVPRARSSRYQRRRLPALGRLSMAYPSWERWSCATARSACRATCCASRSTAASPRTISFFRAAVPP